MSTIIRWFALAAMLLSASWMYGSDYWPQLMVPGDENWGNQFAGGGPNGKIVDMASNGNAIYIVGSFTQAGTVQAEYLARWDGHAWSPVGNANFDGAVKAVALQGDHVYVGGEFTTVNGMTVNGIAKWDGSAWSALGTGINPGGWVNTIKIHGSDVYVGGVFSSAGGVYTYSVAKWDGSTWSGFGGGLSEWEIQAIEIMGSEVYAGGGHYFGSPITHIKKWDGSAWSDLGAGLNNDVCALATDGTDLYAGGYFSGHICRWDGSAWSVVGGGIFDGVNWSEGEQQYNLLATVYSIIIDGTDLLIAGCFEKVGGISISGIAKWNGTEWNGFDAGTYGISDILLINNKLYASSAYNTMHIGNLTEAENIAVWDGTRWSALGNGLNGNVQALKTCQDGIYAGGDFTIGGGMRLNHIGKWDGMQWHPLGKGMNNTVEAIAVDGSNVYAGGQFTQANGFVNANRIARWDGNAWHNMGSGASGTSYPRVSVIAVSGTDVYAGGHFTSMDGAAANYIARWDGSSWHTLGSGTNGEVDAITINGNNVYAGGRFTQAGGVSVNNIARWDGSSWSTLGNGLYGEETLAPDMLCFSYTSFYSDYPKVNSLRFSDGYLYAGGYFTTADGGLPVNHIARWDGSVWTSLGSGHSLPTYGLIDFCEFVHAYVNAVAIIGDRIFTGGYLSHRIQQWDGSNWLDLGSGCSGKVWYSTELINSTVDAMCVQGDLLYVGGTFSEAGGKQSSYMGVWHTSGGGPGPGTPLFSSFTPSGTGPVVTDGGSSMGCAWEDFDNDGDADLFVANDIGEDNFLYENNGDGTFIKITSGDVVTDGGVSWSGSWTDYDNDGDADLFVTHLGGNNRLYENDGSGTFTKITSGAVVSTTASSRGCSWCDYDNDGDADLFVANGNDENNFLFTSNGDGTFTQVTTGPVVTDGGYSTTGTWSDVDLDGYMDLFVTNTTGQNNCLYLNNGDGTFTKETSECLVTDGGESWTASWGDTDNDGDMDLFVGNNAEANFFYVNNGGGSFTKVTTGALVAGADHSRSSTWGDVNNDGHLDLVVSNRNEDSYVYLNEGGGAFTKYYTAAANSRGVALCDFDGDGDLDLCAANDGVNNFLYTNSGNSNHWVQVRCQGTVSNRSAIGARVCVHATIQGSPVIQTRIIGSQTGFGSENHLTAAFGLKEALAISTLEVYWPSGQTTTINNPAVDQVHTIVEGSSTLAPHMRDNLPAAYSLDNNYPNPFNPGTCIPYALPEPAPVTIKIFDLSGREIRTLVHEHQTAGWHRVWWDGTDQRGSAVASGIYVVRLRTKVFEKSRKLIRLQ
ncbi:VCBS repeat-containing protein [bacterium]|nr:VCBS repeat-containing protein [bacterium]